MMQNRPKDLKLALASLVVLADTAHPRFPGIWLWPSGWTQRAAGISGTPPGRARWEHDRPAEEPATAGASPQLLPEPGHVNSWLIPEAGSKSHKPALPGWRTSRGARLGH